MSALALLCNLAGRGVRIAADGNRLILDAPKGMLTADLTNRLRAEKPAILAAIGTRPRCCECDRPIIEEVTTWWGGEAVHHGCGLKAWQQEWRQKAPEREEQRA